MRPRKEVAAFAVAFAGILAGTVRASAQPNEITDRYLTTVQTDLNSSLDTRKAAVGQQVTVTIQKDTRLADNTELPKGTRLVGRITQVQAQDAEHVGSVLAINFDHAELKGGKVVPVRSVIQGVAPVKPMPLDPIAQAGRYGPSGSADTATTRGGLGGGGGGLGDGGTGLGAGGIGGLGGGGGMSAPLPAARPTNPSSTPGTGPSPSPGSVPRSTPNIGDGADPNSPGNLNNPNLNGLPASAAGMERPVTQAGESLSTAPRKTALPGVLLSTTATANASGTLFAPGKNISLTSGTQITLGVITR